MKQGNLFVIFAAILAGAVLLDKGSKLFSGAFGGTATASPAGGAASLGSAAAGQLNKSQQSFATELAAKTGLDVNVIAAWLLAEEPASAAQAPNGANNWLNVGDTGSGNFGGSAAAWANPVSAADATAAWLAGGNAIPGYGTASPGIRSILSTAGQPPAAQITAIQHSGWAASGYPDLPQVYTSVSGQ